MQPTTSRTPPVVTADGAGVVSHDGTVLLAELADRVGLTAALSEATDGLRQRQAGHEPGRVLVDVAVAIADGARTISEVQVLADQQGLHGPAGSVASTPTTWRVLDGIDETMLPGIRQARAVARDRAWLARGELTGAELPGSRAASMTVHDVVIDLDATLVTAHSDKEGAKGNFKGGFGYHPLGAWLDNTGEALRRPALTRRENAVGMLKAVLQLSPSARSARVGTSSPTLTVPQVPEVQRRAASFGTEALATRGQARRRSSARIRLGQCSHRTKHTFDVHVCLFVVAQAPAAARDVQLK